MQEVVQNFLNRSGLDYMAEQFQVNKITGKVLMLLTEVCECSPFLADSFRIKLINNYSYRQINAPPPPLINFSILFPTTPGA